MSTPHVHVLFQNSALLPALLSKLDQVGLEYQLHFVWRGHIDSGIVPPEGVYINRVSPIAKTREQRASLEMTRSLLKWLERHGRRVINGFRAFDLETNRFRQTLELGRFGIKTPRTALCIGRTQLLETSRRFEGPFLVKHVNRGENRGCQIYHSPHRLERCLAAGKVRLGVNGQTMVQEFIETSSPYSTRVELVDGRFVYAMRQAFEVDLLDGLVQKVPSMSASLLTEDDPLVRQYASFLERVGYDVAGIEFIEGLDGERYTCELVGNSNYNATFGESVDVDGFFELARFISREVILQGYRAPVETNLPGGGWNSGVR